MFDWLKPYRKAIASAVLAGLAMLAKVYFDDSTVSAEELWQVVGAAAAAGGFTFAIPNKPLEGGTTTK